MAVKKINTDLQIEAALLDGDGNSGTSNQILISTGTGVDWVDGSGSSIIGGPYLPLTAGSSYPLTGNLYINDSIPKLIFTDTDTSTVASISANSSNLTYTTVTSARDHIFKAGADTLVTIEGTGNVGIGTTSPGAVLSLTKNDSSLYDPTSDDGQRANGPTILLNNNDTTTNTFGQIMYDTDSSGQGVARIVFLDAGTASSAIAFVTEQVDSIGERMRIDSNGNVGIGTDSPGHLLEIRGTGDALSVGNDTNTLTYMRFANERTMIGYSGANAVVQGGLSKGIRFNVNNNTFNSGNAMAIDTSGNVGIGTTSPAQKLDVVGYIRSANTGTDATTKYSGFFGRHYTNSEEDVFAIATEATSTNNNVYIGGGFSTRNSATTIRFTTAANNTTTIGSERMRITSTGNVGIGTTAPTQKLHVAGNMRLQNQLYDSTNSTGSNGEVLTKVSAGTEWKAPAVTSQAASLYDLLPNGAFTKTYAFTSTAGTWAEVMEGNDVITATGTFSVQVFVDDQSVGGTQYDEYYSGTMSWVTSSTNDAGGGAISEIALHRAGHAANSGVIYLRTRETTSAETNKLKLEVMSNKTYTGASNLVFKFVRLI